MTKCSKGPAYGKRESARRSSGKKRGRKKSRGGGAFPLILAFIAGLLAAGGGVLLLRGTSFPELRSLLSAEISVSSPRPAAPAGRIAADAPSPAPGKGRPGKSPASAHKKDTGRTRFPVVPVPPAPSGANSPENHAGKPAEAKISASPSGSERPSGSEGPEAAPRKVLEEGRIKAPPASPAADPPDAAPETPEAVALALAQLQGLPYEEPLPPSRPAPPEDGPPFPHPRGERGGEPCLVIVMDDLGASRPALEQLLALDYPVTFAFWPHGAATRSGAAQALAKSREVIVHQPMEPLGYPEVRPGPNVLMSGMSPEQIRDRLEAALAAVPGAGGLNNHMGSRFTQNPEGVRVVADFLKDRGLFLLDSCTHPRSVFGPEGKRRGAEVYLRDVFLDALPGRGKALEELRRAEGIALRRGWAVAIGHPLPETLIALKDYERLRDKNIRLVRLRDLREADAFRKAHEPAGSRFAATGGRPPE